MLRRVNEMCLRRDIDHGRAIHSHHRGNKYDLLGERDCQAAGALLQKEDE